MSGKTTKFLNRVATGMRRKFREQHPKAVMTPDFTAGLKAAWKKCPWNEKPALKAKLTADWL